MKKDNDISYIGVRVSQAMRTRLEKMAVVEQRTLSNLVKTMLDEGIKRRIDAARVKND